MQARIDLSLCPDRAALHQALARALALPTWYGCNLDALYDCLTTLPNPVHLTVTGQFPQERYAAALAQVLQDSARKNENFTYSIDLSP